MKFIALLVFLVLIATQAFSQDVVTATLAIPSIVEDGGLGAIITLGVDLVKNWKLLGIWGALSSIVVILLSLLNSGLITSIKGFTLEYKRVCNVILSTLLAICSGIYMGGNVWTVLISALFISGGAISIYEVLKGAGVIKTKK